MTDDTTNDDRLAKLLAHPSPWAEPSAELEDAVVRAVADAAPTATTSPTAIRSRERRETMPRRRRFVLSAVAAAAVIAIGVGTVLVTRGGRGAEPEYAARLRATSLAPGAHASADIIRTTAGFRITLDASGLPRLPAGEYYQAWLKNAAGTLVPVGTFSSTDGQVTLWSGVSPRDFPAITVTIEAPDDDQASSGRRVLVGVVAPTS
jgi:hypothetical protein